MTAPVVLLHGFTQTTASFAPLVTALADGGVDTEAVDLPGHGTGEGPGHLVAGDLWDGAADVVARVAPTEPRVWLGYSMGARLALHVALAHPEAVRALVLIGGTAGIDDAGERAARRVSDAALADRIERIGTSAFLEEWLALDLFATLPSAPEQRAERATNSAAGLASSLRRWGTGTMDPPLWDRLGSICVPTLVLAGTFDTKFTDLGRRLAEAIGPTARFAPVPDAGHAAHLERPATVAALVADFVAVS